VNLVIVSYKQEHESGIGTGTIHRKLYARIRTIKLARCLRRLNDSTNETHVLDRVRSFVCSESGEQMEGGGVRERVRVEGGEGGIRVGERRDS